MLEAINEFEVGFQLEQVDQGEQLDCPQYPRHEKASF